MQHIVHAILRDPLARGCLGLAVLLLLAGGVLAGGGSAEDAASGNDTMERTMTHLQYSRSGYDITPLTDAEIAAIAKTITPEQARITQQAGTEPPHCGVFTDVMEPGIYVSVVGGLPLFSSTGKFVSKSGWASFFEPIDPEHIIEREDRSHGMVRTEILDARSGAHLGHVFNDGPPPTGKRYCINSVALTFIPEGEPLPPESQPAAAETAYFAGGCFWGIEKSFSQIPGVIDVVSGYQGGKVASPSYAEVCRGGTGHAETVKVVFDPQRVSYGGLLAAFFGMHDPTSRNRQGLDVGSQYRSAIFTTSAAQARAAHVFIAQLEASDGYEGRKVVTEVRAAPEFYSAEEYHQDYLAKQGGACGL